MRVKILTRIRLIDVANSLERERYAICYNKFRTNVLSLKVSNSLILLPLSLSIDILMFIMVNSTKIT